MGLYIFVQLFWPKSLINFKYLTGFVLCIWTTFSIFPLKHISHQIENQPFRVSEGTAQKVRAPGVSGGFRGCHVAWGADYLMVSLRARGPSCGSSAPCGGAGPWGAPRSGSLYTSPGISPSSFSLLYLIPLTLFPSQRGINPMVFRLTFLVYIYLWNIIFLTLLKLSPFVSSLYLTSVRKSDGSCLFL